MPGPGSTTKKCASCSMPLNVACKTCKYCKAVQPHNLRLKKKIERFDLKSETWAQAQKKNNTSSHLMDDASLLLERFQALGSRGVLFISRPGTKSWTCEVLLPRCKVTESASACLKRMEALFEFVVQGWSQSEKVAASAAEIPQPPVDNSLATSSYYGAPALPIPSPSAPNLDSPTPPAPTLSIPTLPAPTLSFPTTPASTLPIPTTPAPTLSIPTPPVSTLPIPTTSASTLPIPTPPAHTLPIPTTPASTLPIPTPPAHNLAIPAPGGNKRKKNNDCSHSSQEVFKGDILKERVKEGRKEYLLKWHPCSLCGKKWRSTWVEEDSFLM
ncbi:SH3 domain-containing protein C23A1.17-like [Carassius auratus]|uniref:SH3 domain-containing protein C23A1.17-like n=1 Tax=Carassius auratus TaxID=7957 RepID=A0A6P6JAE9_CARAU|nr:SH3 domain-containing protein C23A1.17-like [Carassius auratus]